MKFGSPRVRALLRGGGVIALAMAVMNVTTYAFTLVAARFLGPEEYGALAAVMGLLLVVNVLSLGLQATGARRVSARPQDRSRIEREVMATSYVCAAVLGLVVLAAAPLVTRVLNLESPAAAVLIAATAVPLSVMGGQAGIVQGEGRWGALAGIYLAVGIGRLGFGAAGMLLRPDAAGAMLGVFAGALLPVLVGAVALRTQRERRPGDGTGRPALRRAWSAGGVLRESLHNSHALLAFFALSNADVIIARSTLDERAAGLYAGGLIMTKAVLFLPQFVVVITFPSMSRQGAGRRMHLVGLAAVLAMGGVTVAGVALLSQWAVVFVGGPAYADLQGSLWLFAALGTLLALIQVMIYDLVARQHQRLVLVVWVALAVLLGAGVLVSSIGALLAAVLAVDVVLLAVLLVVSLRRSGRQPGRGPGTRSALVPSTS